MGATTSQRVSPYCIISFIPIRFTHAFYQQISGDAITRARQNSHIALPESNIHSTNYWTGSAEVEMEFRQTYEVLRLLGRGASAEVYLIRHRQTKEEYACKIVKKTNSSMNDARTMKTETTIMKKLQDKHLLRMHELYETEDTIWMILDYAEGGDMMHALASLPNYSERNVAKIFKQMLLGVKYLHSEGIVHRDLKLDNILYSKQEEGESEESEIQVKIADFGLSALTSVKRTSENSKKVKSMKSLKEMWGTTEYFAPEVYERAYGSQADIWALGCILYEMLTGDVAFPFRDSNDDSLVDKVMTKAMLKKKAMRSFEMKDGWKELSAEAQSLIKGMLKRNATMRFDVDECLAHPWITGEGLEARHSQELNRTKKIVKERSERRLRRYESLINEMKKAEAHRSKQQQLQQPQLAVTAAQ